MGQFDHQVWPQGACQPASVNFLYLTHLFFLDKSSVELKTERIICKLSCHQHIIWTHHPLSLSLLNVGVIQSRQAEKKNCLLGLLLVFNLEKYHNQHDLHPVATTVQLPEPPEVCFGWLIMRLACAEEQCGTLLVARLVPQQDTEGLIGAFSLEKNFQWTWWDFSLSQGRTSNLTAVSMAWSNSSMSLVNIFEDH